MHRTNKQRTNESSIIKCTDNLIYHLIRIIENSQGKPIKQERNKNNKSRNTKEERKIMQLRKEEKKQRFEEIVILYKKKSEFTQENWHKNEWKDWKHNEETWHTKARWPEQGLHLVVYHLGSDDKMGYRNGFIIIKDHRFINGENYLPLRIELEPTYDTKRKLELITSLGMNSAKENFTRNSTEEWKTLKWHLKHMKKY